jgi:ribokinase
VSHVNLEGETLAAHDLEQKHGGKGLNQAVALARAGAEVFMAGCVGPDGDLLVETLRAAGVHTDDIYQSQTRSGHAIIQLADSGANAIVIYGGANERITPEMIDQTLAHFAPGDYILLQNEISCVDHAIRAAKERGMKVAFNPSPISERLMTYPLELVDLFILNELEGQTLAGTAEGAEDAEVLAALAERFPQAVIVLTLGGKGVLYHDAACDLSCAAHRVPVVDTTGAGDTFCGYFLACILKGLAPMQALEMANRAGALSIGKKGASVSIPTLAEVEQAVF